MNTLFISTYNEIITIGLLKDGIQISCLEKESNRSHSILLIPMIKQILDENKMDTSMLNEIVVVNGPGSFTGIRLGVTVAKTLAYTLNIKIKTISSIEAISASIDEENIIVSIKDTKGAYVGKFTNNKLDNSLVYMSNKEYEEYLLNNTYPVYEDAMFDLEKIYEYLKDIPYQTPHAVNPIYIKGIEALNGR